MDGRQVHAKCFQKLNIGSVCSIWWPTLRSTEVRYLMITSRQEPTHGTHTKHWSAMEQVKSAATEYLRNWCKMLWTRSQFSSTCKVDYVTNNLAESFNNWIKQYKSMNLDGLMDKIRQVLMVKWNQRRKVAMKLEGSILPHIIQKLNERSRDLDMDVLECSSEVGEVSVLSDFRCVVNLQGRTCTCRKWQVCGIPCVHAIAFITSLTNVPLENYVYSYYSVQIFRAAYDHLIPAMPDKSQWPKGCHGFFMHPPLLKSTAGRRKTQRFKGSNETVGNTTRKKGQHKCPICKDYGHHWHKCKKGWPSWHCSNDVCERTTQEEEENHHSIHRVQCCSFSWRSTSKFYEVPTEPKHWHLKFWKGKKPKKRHLKLQLTKKRQRQSWQLKFWKIFEVWFWNWLKPTRCSFHRVSYGWVNFTRTETRTRWRWCINQRKQENCSSNQKKGKA